MASTVYSLVRKGDSYRLSYFAKNGATGLTNITAQVLNPAGAVGAAIPWSGTNPALGFVEGVNGWYYTDINTTALAIGAWHYLVDSASQKASAGTRIQVVDATTLDDTVFEGLMTNVGVAISELQNATYGLSALEQRIDSIEGATFDTGTDSLEAIRDYLVNTIKGSLDSIKNNISCAVSVPAEVVLPKTGSITRRIYVTTYGPDGAVNDPDTNAIALLAFDPAGVDVTLNFFGSATPALTRDAVGQYHIDMTIKSTDSINNISLKTSYAEVGVAKVRWDNVELVDAATDLTSTLNAMSGATFSTTTDSLEAIRNALDGYLNNGGTIDLLLDTLTSDVAAVKGVVDGIQLDLSNSTDGLGALKILIDAVNTDLSNGTDGLGALKTLIDADHDILTNATYGLSALQTIVADIQTNMGSVDLSTLKGTGYVEATDSLKAISDKVYYGGFAF